MSAALIDYTSAYLSTLHPTEADAETLNQLAIAATQWVEARCNRAFTQAEFDEICTVGQDQSVMLKNTPVAYISRVLTATGNYLKLSSTAPLGSYGTSSTALNLVSITNGVRTNTSLSFTTYPTLSALATAVSTVSGWTGSVTSGFGNYPSSDLVASQAGNVTGTPTTLVSWQNDARQISFNPTTGIIEGTGGITWNEPFPLVWNSTGSAGFLGLYGFCRWQQVRVIYTAGFTPDQIPEPLKQLVGNLVISAFQNPEGRSASLTIGGEYSFSLMDYEKLAISDKMIIAQYRNRRI